MYYGILLSLFVFSCFTGLAYIDVANLKDSNIVVINGHKWIMTKRQKTGIPTNVILLDIAETILKKYEGKCKDNAEKLDRQIRRLFN